MRNIISFIHDFGVIYLLLIFYLCWNILTFLLYGIDKQKAIKNKWRLSERLLLFFTWTLGSLGALLALMVFHHKKRKFKFKFSIFGGMILSLVFLIHLINGLTFGRMIAFVEVDFTSPNWQSEMDGYRIAFMTDFHAITDEDMADVIGQLNTLNLDLLLLGGDFSSDVWIGGNHFEGTLREISTVVTTDGVFGVEGNHDIYYRLFDVKNRYGIGVLDNSGNHIRPGFYVAGVHDLWNRTPDVAAAIYDSQADDFVLLITHNPDVAMMQSTVGVDFILAGHTHGGQITFFGWPFYLLRQSVTNYGTRFSHGFNTSMDNVPIFNSRGVGPYYNWPRIFARPEVIIFTMYNE